MSHKKLLFIHSSDPGDALGGGETSLIGLVGRLDRDEVLVIEGALDGFYYVNNGKAAGWVAKEDVAPYKEPAPGTVQPQSNTTPTRSNYGRRRY